MRKPFFTSDRISKIRNTWPNLVFPLMPPHPLNWLELGCFEGQSALWLVESLLYHPASKIYCVGEWDLKKKPHLLAGYDYETVFDENTRHVNQIIKRKGSPEEILPVFTPQQFDGCYINASPEKEDVLRDARLALPLMKPGGIIIFDDYEWRQSSDGVQRSVRQLFTEWKEMTRIVNIGGQVIFQLVGG
jgi:predicted O-methyltransferase YrrM